VSEGRDGIDRAPLITGIGVVAPSGVGAEEHWAATLRGERQIGPITGFDASGYPVGLAGQVRDFDPEAHVERRLLVQTDRWSWLGLAATVMALDDAGIDLSRLDPYGVAVVLASSSGGNEFGQREIQKLWSNGSRAVSAYQSIAWFYAATTGQVSIKHGMKGHCGVLATEGAGGLDSIAQAMRVLRRGATVVLAGGTEAPVAPYVLTCQLRGGHLSTERDPGRAYRPFDAAAGGAVPGEGGAVLVVEDAGAAERRGASAYAEIAGYAATHDAHHHSRHAPDGEGLARAMALALARAGTGPGEIDAVFADAAGTPEGDRAEALALRQVFGKHAGEVLVTAPKSMVGRLYAGGASLDVATAALAIRDGLVPPTVNLDQPAPGCELRFVTGEPARAEVSTVLVNARGFGGFNAALVLRRPSPPSPQRQPGRQAHEHQGAPS
jgi:minimal PKS chain-length factor (CLF/KS beta)